MTLASLLSIVVMVLGFGFVIFWHELGHFLGARRAGIRVEQFAVGMGPPVFSYRKGIGFRIGSTMAEFERRTQAEFDAREIRQKERRGAEGKLYEIRVGELTIRERYDIAADLGLGETEYRLSALPIGGYVKPTGQDDLRPSHIAASYDPKSYAAASVGNRMVLISAGVIMNVILAGILFFVLFLYGFRGQKPVVGQVQSGSPAAFAGVRGGDELVSIDGHALADFTKLVMNVALLPSDRDVPLVVRRDGAEQTLMIGAKATSDNGKLLALGVQPASKLVGVEPGSEIAKEIEKHADELTNLYVRPGERVALVNGVAMKEDDYAGFDATLQRLGDESEKYEFQITGPNDSVRMVQAAPQFAATFNQKSPAFAGLMPRTEIGAVPKDPAFSSAAGVLQEGDVILAITQTDGPTTEPVATPSTETFRAVTTKAGSASKPLIFTVLRGGTTATLTPIVPKTKIGAGIYGLGVGLRVETEQATIGEVAAGSAAAKAGVPVGAVVRSVNGQSVKNWRDVRRAIVAAKTAGPVTIDVTEAAGKQSSFAFDLSDADLATARTLRYVNPLDGLADLTQVRKTGNPLTAFAWGVGETRDLILQGYVTIQRVFGGSVPVSNMSGPIGIFRAGTSLAQRGPDWFIWFLAVVSANLAVVNFLPVPILDGWHFLSLVKEKLTGRPVSERVQEVAQYVGLAMILSLLVFVSYNDILRW
jgi:regulator of sigma E protease